MSLLCSNKHPNIIRTTTLAEFRQYSSWPNGVCTELYKLKTKKRKLHQHLEFGVSDAQQPKGSQASQIPGGFCGNTCSRNICLICHCCGSWLEIYSDFLFSDEERDCLVAHINKSVVLKLISTYLKEKVNTKIIIN